jgi:hypothetical protein
MTRNTVGTLVEQAGDIGQHLQIHVVVQRVAGVVGLGRVLIDQEHVVAGESRFGFGEFEIVGDDREGRGGEQAYAEGSGGE